MTTLRRRYSHSIEFCAWRLSLLLYAIESQSEEPSKYDLSRIQQREEHQSATLLKKKVFEILAQKEERKNDTQFNQHDCVCSSRCFTVVGISAKPSKHLLLVILYETVKDSPWNDELKQKQDRLTCPSMFAPPWHLYIKGVVSHCSPRSYPTVLNNRSLEFLLNGPNT